MLLLLMTTNIFYESVTSGPSICLSEGRLNQMKTGVSRESADVGVILSEVVVARSCTGGRCTGFRYGFNHVFASQHRGVYAPEPNLPRLHWNLNL